MKLIDESSRFGRLSVRSLLSQLTPRLQRWVLPAAGLGAFLWFLIRVLPKPSRAAYPCQRAAFPMAAAFTIWVISGLGLRPLWRRCCEAASRSRHGQAVLFAALVALCLAVFLATTPRQEVAAVTVTPTHAALGTGRGVYPGRVVWVHNPEATDWEGEESGEEWDNPVHTHQPTVNAMLDEAVCRLAGKQTVREAWSALFAKLNTERGRGAVGYKVGEQIMIKINLTLSNASMSSLDDNYNRKKTGWLQGIYNNIEVSPQMILALLRQLVYEVGVEESDIMIGDPLCLMPNDVYNVIHPEFPDLRFIENKGNESKGRTRVEFSTKKFYWSTPEADGKEQDYAPDCYAEASYLINFAVPKSHTFAGITACAKNHYGSMLRSPTGSLRDVGQKNYFNLHHALVNSGEGGQPGTGNYRCLVDITGHPDFGGKTVLYILDMLYSGTGWEGNPVKWQMAPFNDDWPSSVLVSMDPVAIDSVAYDFLRTEWSDLVLDNDFEGGAEDYLHEAAQANNPPSGTFYDPTKSGQRLGSLGVHEHWNNATEKKYSRNLGLNTGIELVKLTRNARAPEPAFELRPALMPGQLRLYGTGLTPGRTYVVEEINPATGVATEKGRLTNASYGARWSATIPNAGPTGASYYRFRELP